MLGISSCVLPVAGHPCVKSSNRRSISRCNLIKGSTKRDGLCSRPSGLSDFRSIANAPFSKAKCHTSLLSTCPQISRPSSRVRSCTLPSVLERFNEEDGTFVHSKGHHTNSGIVPGRSEVRRDENRHHRSGKCRPRTRYRVAQDRSRGDI